MRDKTYVLRTIERARSFLLAECVENRRILQIYEIDAEWILRHFNMQVTGDRGTQDWLDKNV